MPTVEAAALGAVDYPTLGIAGHVLSGTGLVKKETQQALKEAHPVATAAGGVAGLIGANLIPGVGEAADLAAGAEAAEGVAGAAEAGNALLQAKNLVPSNAIGAIAEHLVPGAAANAGALAKIGSGTARGMVEGGLFGAGQTGVDAAHNLLIGDPDHATEHILSEGGMNTLLAAGLGGVLGGGLAGAGVLRDVVKPTVLKAATAASDALKEQQGTLAMDVLGTTTAQMKRLYGKGTRGLDAIKEATGAKGEDYPEVLGNILSSQDAIVPNPQTGALEPLITAGDTAVTVAEKIQTMRDAAGDHLQTLYQAMDKAGPGVSKQDLVDELAAAAEKFRGDPAAVSTRNQLVRISEAIGENEGEFLKPTDLWRLRKNNDADIFRRTTGVMRENVDAEMTYRDALKDAITDYAKDLPSLTRWPNPSSLDDVVAANLGEDLARANGKYSLWAELGKIADAGAESQLAKAPSTADLLGAGIRGGVRGAKGGALLGGLGAGALGVEMGGAGGAVLGATTRIARELIGPSVASRTLGAVRSLSDFLAEVAPRLRELAKVTVPEAVQEMWESAGHAAVESSVASLHERPWELPANATGVHVHELERRLANVASNAQLAEELKEASPGLALALSRAGRGTAGRLKARIPTNPYKGVPGAEKRWSPTRQAVQAYNDYARGAVGGVGPTLRLIAQGRATSARVAGTRETYPGMSARADALIADQVRRNPDLLNGRGVKASLGVWLGRPDPLAVAVSRAVQQAGFTVEAPAPHPGPIGGRQLGQNRIDKLSAPSSAETATQATARRLGKD